MNNFIDMVEFNDRSLIKIEINQDFYIEWLEKHFSIGMNRIVWSKIPNHFYMKFDLLDSSSKGDLLVSLNNIANRCDIDDNQIIYFLSDGYFEDVYSMPFHVFQKYIETIISLPHHCYIFSCEKKWCFNFTFEDDFYFGFSSALN
jgi:hypothetical protein